MATRSAYEAEARLQEMIFREPDIIPFEDIDLKLKGRRRVAIKELGLSGSGSSDIVMVDEEGEVYLIETKLATNDEIRRKAIGQILEYAAYLSKQDFVWLEGKFREHHGKDFWELFGDSVGCKKENFEENVASNLEKGRFRLMIVVDEINETLRTTTEFMRGKRGIDISVVVLRWYQEPENKIEILVPAVFGVAQIPKAAPPRPTWDEESFFEDARQRTVDHQTFLTLQRMYQLSKELGEVSFGKGKEATFRLGITSKGTRLTFLTIKSSGRGSWFSFRGLKQLGVDANVIKSYIQDLKTLGLPFDENSDWNRYPSFDITLLNSDDKFGRFKEATSRFLGSIGG